VYFTINYRHENSIYLTKGTFAYEGIDLVTIEPLLAWVDDVIVVRVIVTVVVHVDLALLVTALISLTPSNLPFLLCIVHLKDANMFRSINCFLTGTNSNAS
jgi:hypothetical protein